VIAAWRAELLVLRKWRVVWMLVALSPAIVLVQSYVFGFLEYLLVTPAEAMAMNLGSPPQQLGPLFPSQAVIVAVSQFEITLPFLLLGAVVAGSDWSFGTVTTALLQGPGRVRSTLGQVLAVMTAAAVSVMATFAVAWVAAEFVWWRTGLTGRLAATPAPTVMHSFEAVGVGLLVGFVYSGLGLLLGVTGRSAAAGLAGAVAFYYLIDGFLYTLSLDAGGWVADLYSAFPGQSVTTLTGEFGTPGGGVISQNYEPLPGRVAGVILCVYLAVLVGSTVLVVRRRDITGKQRRLPRRWRPARRRVVAVMAPSWWSSLRAELTVVAHWPAMWAFMAAFPVLTFLGAYPSQVVLYLFAGHGSIEESSPLGVLPTLEPSSIVTAVLNSVGPYGSTPGAVLFLLIGAIVAGTHWSGGREKTALLQGPGRTATSTSEAAAVGICAAASVVGAFVLAVGGSLASTLVLTGSLSAAVSGFPGMHLIAGVGVLVLIAWAWAATGWFLAVLFRSATAAFGIGMLWNLVIQSQLDYFVLEVKGPFRILYDLLPDASTNTMSQLFGYVNYYGGPPTYGAVPLAVAVVTLLAYIAFSVWASTGLTRRRDLA
jgi:ABC-2 type transport system permease protein